MRSVVGKFSCKKNLPKSIVATYASSDTAALRNALTSIGSVDLDTVSVFAVTFSPPPAPLILTISYPSWSSLYSSWGL